MDLDFSPVWAGWQDLAYGTLVTIEVTIGAIVLGCLIGLAVGLGRLNPRRRILFGLCTAYLSIVRGTPLLVQLFIWFFGLPHFGLNLPAFVCGVLGMGIYSGAYVSEIVRGAIQSVDRGQMEAARHAWANASATASSASTGRLRIRYATAYSSVAYRS